MRILVFMVALGLWPIQRDAAQTVTTSFAKPRVEYCDADQDIAWASIHISATFSNRHQESVILSHTFGPSAETTVSDLSGVEIYMPQLHTYVTEEPSEPGEAPDMKVFEILKPGSSTDRELIFSVQVSKDPAHRVDSTPTPGTHLVSAIRALWPFDNDNPQAVSHCESAGNLMAFLPRPRSGSKVFVSALTLQAMYSRAVRGIPNTE